jgi:glyoxalase/bleomycin resistance protein/dioxygenase superfamily protein
MPRRSAGEARPKHTNGRPPFIQLDYLYVPCADVAKDLEYFTGVLGAELAFAVEGMGARVAMVRLTEGPPHVLLTDHLEGDRPILIYRVADLDEALADLKARGWKKAQTLEIPMGPCCSFTTPTGHRIAVYELTRPEVANHFMGRRDF